MKFSNRAISPTAVEYQNIDEVRDDIISSAIATILFTLMVLVALYLIRPGGLELNVAAAVGIIPLSCGIIGATVCILLKSYLTFRVRGVILLAGLVLGAAYNVMIAKLMGHGGINLMAIAFLAMIIFGRRGGITLGIIGGAILVFGLLADLNNWHFTDIDFAQYANLPVFWYQRIGSFVAMLYIVGTSLNKINQALTKNLTDLSIRSQQLAQTVHLQEEQLIKERLMEAHRRSFVTAASHEFRTPLSVIQLSSHILKKKTAAALPSEEFTGLQKYFKNIDRAKNNMAALLEQLVAADDQKGTASLVPVEINLAQAMRQLIHEHGLAAPDKRIVWHEELKSCSVTTDQGLFELTMRTLLSNALKFSPEDTVINIDIIERNNHLTIRVTDQGIGIPQEELEQVLLPFYRSKVAESSAIPGLGLGLTLLNQALIRHGGTLAIKSHPDQGTEVEVNLPTTSMSDSAPGAGGN